MPPAPPIAAPPRTNVADRLATAAVERPDAVALAAARRGGGFDTITYARLDDDATRLARGLAAMGVGPGKRIALLVRPGIGFVTLVFALLRSGATMVLVDAGLGRKNIVRCLASTEPDGFVAIPLGHAMRLLKRREFPKAKLNVTVGRRWGWGGETLSSLRELGLGATPPTDVGGSPEIDTANRVAQSAIAHTAADDPAAIVFTSGSTGPPKGVLYRHETFTTQADEIQSQYDLRPGGVDLACFPLFGLFNVACGVTTVLPEMDFSRPASCDPRKLIAAANEWRCTQAFASPAVWDRLSRHCEATGESLPTLRKVFSCGAPVPATVLRRTLACVHQEAEMHTPYGATESLPVATIEAREILDEAAAETDRGAGVCVGRKFDTIDWRVVRITDDPIATIDDAEPLPPGEIGELIVRGPQVSREYLPPQPEASAPGSPSPNALAKIADGPTVWHRIGDVGYFDDQQRFWYCGRKSQRVRHRNGDLFADQIEAAINAIPGIRRSALVSVDARPVIVTENESRTGSGLAWEDLLESEPSIADLWYGNGSHNGSGESFTEFPRVLVHPKLPTDIRHNSKIRREELAVWAAKQLRKRE